MRPQPLLALQRERPGTFALLMAAACLLMLLATALSLSLHRAALAVDQANAQHFLIQIIDPDPQQRGAVADRVTNRLDALPAVISSRRVAAREAQTLIAPYIAGMGANDLPLPIMIELQATDRVAVAGALHGLPTARLTDIGAELGPLVKLIAALRTIALGVATATGIATGLIATLAARAALAREEPTLTVLHALGATDHQLSSLVTGKIARDAAIGALAGFVLASCVILKIGSHLAAAHVGIAADLGAASWAMLLGLAILLIAIAIASAQLALLSTMRRAT